MEVKAGYRPTAVGAIPEDWAFDPLGAHALSTAYGPRFPGENYDVHGNVALLRTTDLDDEGHIHLEQMPLANLSLTQFETHFLKANDFLVTRSGTCGLSAVFTGFEMPVLPGAFLIRIRLCEDVDPVFLKFFFNSECGKRYLQRLTEGGVQKNIRGSALIEMPFPFPPSHEQRAIAEALSDMDTLLGGLDRLIAKKGDLKQAAMQQLLTGQTRLPGFFGEWQIKTFAELFHFSGGYSASRDQLSTAGFCYLHYGDIHTSNKSFVDVRAEFQDIPKLNVALKRVAPTSLLEDGDVVFVDASEDDDGASRHVVVINPDSIPLIAGLHTIVAKPKTDELSHAYRRHCFQTSDIKRQILFYAVGTKVTGISKTNIAKLKMPVPSVREQAAIAEVLADMDAELATLEQRRSKTRALKQAMMQELLTGRIRLV